MPPAIDYSSRCVSRRGWVALFGIASAVGDFSIVWHIIGWLRAVGSAHRMHQAIALTCVLGVESLIRESRNQTIVSTRKTDDRWRRQVHGANPEHVEFSEWACIFCHVRSTSADDVCRMAGVDCVVGCRTTCGA